MVALLATSHKPQGKGCRWIVIGVVVVVVVGRGLQYSAVQWSAVPYRHLVPSFSSFNKQVPTLMNERSIDFVCGRYASNMPT